MENNNQNQTNKQKYVNGEKYVLKSKVQESKKLYYFEVPLKTENK